MNVFDYLFEQSRSRQKEFLLGNSERISYSDLHEQALILAGYIQDRFGRDNNIILISPNSVFFILCYLGILKSGNVCVPLSPTIEKENLDHIVSLCKSTLAFISKRVSHRERIQQRQCLDEDDLQLVLKHDSPDNPVQQDDFDDSKLAEIIFTSGSTGKPKGVMISHRNIIANTNSILSYLPLDSSDVILVVLPFYYCYGLSLLHTHLRVGGGIVLNNNFMFTGSVVKDLQKYQCTGFSGVPSHFQILLRKTKSFTATPFPHLKYVTQAGGKLHNTFIKEFIEGFPEVTFFVMYGQTEATARLSYLHPDLIAKKIGSIGKGIPGVTLAIRDENGEEIELPGVVGELVASGDNVMMGYFGEEKDSNDTLEGGWLHTGDLAYMDEDGFFYLTARKKEIIKVMGKRISPKEIEEVIVSIPGVVDCNISAVFDEIQGEAISADVVISDASKKDIDAAYIQRVCSERLSPEKVPAVVKVSSTLSLAETGKKVKS